MRESIVNFVATVEIVGFAIFSVIFVVAFVYWLVKFEFAKSEEDK